VKSSIDHRTVALVRTWQEHVLVLHPWGSTAQGAVGHRQRTPVQACREHVLVLHQSGPAVKSGVHHCLSPRRPILVHAYPEHALAQHQWGPAVVSSVDLDGAAPRLAEMHLRRLHSELVHPAGLQTLGAGKTPRILMNSMAVVAHRKWCAIAHCRPLPPLADSVCVPLLQDVVVPTLLLTQLGRERASWSNASGHVPPSCLYGHFADVFACMSLWRS